MAAHTTFRDLGNSGRVCSEEVPVSSGEKVPAVGGRVVADQDQTFVIPSHARPHTH
jgi:hypothetical protein